MDNVDIKSALTNFVDGRTVLGISLIRIDGTVIASHFVGVQGSNLNLLARESLSAKRRRGDVFPFAGGLILSATKYEKLWIGLTAIDDGVYLLLAAKPKLSLSTFCKRFQHITDAIKKNYWS